MDTATPAPSRISRVRHETRRRQLTVKAKTLVAPGLVRFTFTSDELPGFTSLGFDDHIKLFIDVPGGEPAMRDYTPRRYDPVANELDIEFALHEDGGPATAWANSAEIGSVLNIGGPRGSFVIADAFEWYVFAGDETALPAIARRLGELRMGVPVQVFVEVEAPRHEIVLPSKAAALVTWVYRGGPGLIDAIRAAGLPKGDGYVWIAGEASEAKALRALVVDELGHPSDAIRAAAYWHKGEIGVHQVLDGTPGR